MSNDTPEGYVDIQETVLWGVGEWKAYAKRLHGDNARLREEVEMLNVRHAAAMLHAQTHADEYNALREELAVQSNANIGLMEELAEAKRTDDITMTAFATLEGKFKEQVQRAEQAEARALAAEKDAGRLVYACSIDFSYVRFASHVINVGGTGDVSDCRTFIDTIIAGAKHD